MAKSSIPNIFRSLTSWVSPSPINTPVDNTSEVCRILLLPTETLQTITDYLNIHDAISLSRTCRLLYTLINDNNFWIHRIHSQYPKSMARRYTLDLFQEPEIILTNDEVYPSGFNHVRVDAELDRAAIESATHYNEQAIANRHAKMYMSKEEFLKNVQYFQFKRPNDHLKIPLMKLIFFYLIDRKRTAAVDMNVTHRNDRYLVECKDKDSLKGRIIHLRSVCWLEINGHFEHLIMPGKYEVIWRMKCNSDNTSIWGETEFIVVPSRGKMLINNVSENDFRDYVIEHGNRWFSVSMGHIMIYELSRVFIGIRNWRNLNWKSGVSWDCMELKLIP